MDNYYNIKVKNIDFQKLLGISWLNALFYKQQLFNINLTLIFQKSQTLPSVLKIMGRTQKREFVYNAQNDGDSSSKLKSKQISQFETSKFNKFQIVWAKISGYPWWPAIVTTIPDEKDNTHIKNDFKNGIYFSQIASNSNNGYRVDFIADQTHAYLKKNFLLKYKQNREKLINQGLQYSRRKRRFFQMAISQADQLIQVLQISKNQMQEEPNQKIQESESSFSDQQQKEVSSSQIKQNNYLIEDNLYSTNIKTNKIQHISSNQLQKEECQVNQTQQKQFQQQEQQQERQHKNQTTNVQKKKRGRPIKKPRNNFIKKIPCIQKENKESQAQQKSIQISQKQQFKTQKFKIENHICYQKRAQLDEDLQKQTKSPQSYVHPIESTQSHHQQDRQIFISNLLLKYKLNKVDELQEDFKNKNKKKQAHFIQQEAKKMKGSKSISFIKHIMAKLNDKKQGKKNVGNKVNLNKIQQTLFTENLVMLAKFKQSDQQKISSEQIHFLVQQCKKWTARKILKIVEMILNKNRLSLDNQQIMQEVRKRSLQLAEHLFLSSNFDNIQLKNTYNGIGKKKNNTNCQNMGFISNFKSKLHESVKFLQLLSLQNWYLLTKTENFPQQMCFLIKSLQQYLQKSCGLIVKSQQRYQDLIKHMAIQNEKTAFICGQPSGTIEHEHYSNQMDEDKYCEEKHENVKNYVLPVVQEIK